MRVLLGLALLAVTAGCDGTTVTQEAPEPITLDISGIVKGPDGSAFPLADLRLVGHRLTASGEPAQLQHPHLNDDGTFAFSATFPLTRIEASGACIARVRTGEIRVVLIASDATGQWAAATPACHERPQTLTLIVP